MKWLFIVVALSMLSISCFSQILKSEADSMSRVLRTAKTNSQKADLNLRLAQYHIMKLGENKADFDSAIAHIKEAKGLLGNEPLRALDGFRKYTEAMLIKEQGDPGTALRLIDEAISTLETAGNKYYLAKAIYERSNHYLFQDTKHTADKMKLVERALSLFREIGDRKEVVDCLKMMGDLSIIMDDSDKAVPFLKEAERICNEINYTRQLAGIYDLLSTIHLHKSDYKSALQYELSALKTCEEHNDTTMQYCAVTTTLASIYSYLARYDLSLKYFKKALEVAMKYDDHYAVSLTIFNVSKCYNYLGQQQDAVNFLASLPVKFLRPTDPLEKALVGMAHFDAFLGSKLYEKAGPYCTMLLQLIEKENIPFNFINIIHRLAATFYLETGQLDKALHYMKRNAPITKDLNNAKWIALDEGLWYKLDSSRGDYRSAFSHLLTFKSMSDSLFNETKAKQLQQMEIEYETAKKNDSLRVKDEHISLLTQKNELQQSNLKKSNLIKSITIGATLLALLVLLLFYRQYQRKQRNNRIISQKNQQLQHLVDEKEWLLKEVHHRVKNNLHTVIGLLESQSAYLIGDALEANELSKHRIYAMSIIHQQLYRANDLSSIDMSVYLPELIDYLKESFEASRHIVFRLEIDPMTLNVTQAIPVALIINEAVTNSIKYAFAGRTDGTIDLRMRKVGEMVALAIEDNGKGLDTTIFEKDTSSFGLKLMKGLSEDLSAELRILSNEGTKIHLAFTAADAVN